MNTSLSPGSAAVTPPTTVTDQYLTFDIGTQLFAVPILNVQEIRGWGTPAKIPRTDCHILGVINLRGMIVPIVDVRTRLGMEKCEVTATTVVVIVRVDIDGRPTTAGCVVDAVSDVVCLSNDLLSPPPESCGTKQTRYVRGVASINAGLVLVLDMERLLATNDAFL